MAATTAESASRRSPTRINEQQRDGGWVQLPRRLESLYEENVIL